jgi:hypothetical protein
MTLGHQWNMDRLRDIAYDMGCGNPSVSQGIWSATRRNSDPAYFFPLSPGFILPTYGFYPSYYTEGTPYGPLNPINGNKFRQISFRMSMQQSARSDIYFFWTRNAGVWPADSVQTQYTGRAWFSDKDATFVGPEPSYTYAYVNNATGFRIYDFDLSINTWGDDRIQHLTLPAFKQYKPWGSTIYGLQIWPSPSAPVGSTVSMDWIRLYDPDTSPEVDIEWQTQGVDFDNWTSIQLFIDTDNQGFDGDLFLTSLENDGLYTLKTAALPPGDYYAYLKVVRHENSAITPIARSGYSALIRVGEPPLFEFTAPSFTSGADYATTELGNPWDFSGAGDYSRVDEISSIQYVGGVMDAYQNAPLPGQSRSDARISLNTRKNGSVVPINTAKYRYFTFRMKADISATVDQMDRAARGWGVKLAWWTADLATDGTYTKDLYLFEDWKEYTADLWDGVLVNPNYPYQKGWLAVPSVSTFRFDPLETPVLTHFWLDDIKLCAIPAPTGNVYTIKWKVADRDSDDVVVKLFYGYYVLSSYNEYPDPIAVITQAPGPGAFSWPMTQFPNDQYYLRAEVTDGTWTNSWMSKVPVAVTGSYPRMDIEVMDAAIYNGQSFYWNIALASDGVIGRQWGFPPSVPVVSDFDGDGASDLGIFYNTSGSWYVWSTKKTNVIVWAMQWGWPGATAVPGDYDNDGVDDLAVYDENTGRWFIWSLAKTNVILWNLSWGWRGAKPVSGDYDGDGCADLAVLDKNIGNWYIYSVKKQQVIRWNFNWGWAGCDFVPGDFDGDDCADLAVFDRNTSNWFIYSIKKNQTLRWFYNWGFPGVTALGGDYDNDGATDLVAYYEPTGYWYFNFSGGGTDVGGPWGGTGWKPMVGNFDGQ